MKIRNLGSVADDYFSRCFPTVGQSAPGFCCAARIFIVPRQMPPPARPAYRIVPNGFCCLGLADLSISTGWECGSDGGRGAVVRYTGRQKSHETLRGLSCHCYGRRSNHHSGTAGSKGDHQWKPGSRIPERALSSAGSTNHPPMQNRRYTAIRPPAGLSVRNCFHCSRTEDQVRPAAFSALKEFWILFDVNFEFRSPAWISASKEREQFAVFLATPAWINDSSFVKSTNFAPE